jgi:hypothetical protein
MRMSPRSREARQIAEYLPANARAPQRDASTQTPQFCVVSRLIERSHCGMQKSAVLAHQTEQFA